MHSKTSLARCRIFTRRHYHAYYCYELTQHSSCVVFSSETFTAQTPVNGANRERERKHALDKCVPADTYRNNNNGRQKMQYTENFQGKFFSNFAVKISESIDSNMRFPNMQLIFQNSKHLPISRHSPVNFDIAH